MYCNRFGKTSGPKDCVGSATRGWSFYIGLTRVRHEVSDVRVCKRQFLQGSRFSHNVNNNREEDTVCTYIHAYTHACINVCNIYMHMRQHSFMM